MHISNPKLKLSGAPHEYNVQHNNSSKKFEKFLPDDTMKNVQSANRVKVPEADEF